MDKATLVSRGDIDISGRILEALNRAEVPVTLGAWHNVPDLGESEFIVATPLYDDKGPLAANRRILGALQDAGIYKQVPLLRLSVRSPWDPLVKALSKDLAARSEGFVHIVRRDKTTPLYSVIFAPFVGRGGAVPAKHVEGKENLRRFLIDRIHISGSAVDDALADLQHRSSTSIFPVQLAVAEARKLGLA